MPCKSTKMLATGVPVINAVFTRQVERGIGRTAGKTWVWFPGKKLSLDMPLPLSFSFSIEYTHIYSITARFEQIPCQLHFSSVRSILNYVSAFRLIISEETWKKKKYAIPSEFFLSRLYLSFFD